MLEVKNLRVGYGSLEVIKDISFTVGAGEIVTILGSNGAGKSTTLRALSGLHRATSGHIVFDGADISSAGANIISQKGLCLVPEGRQLFPEHTVLENLELGAFVRLRSGDRAGVKADMEMLFDLFPRVRERLSQKAGLLSGGEQQMVAVARALISRPKLLMLDEPSLGLAPMLVRSLFDTLARLRKTGVTLLLVEQMAHLALSICDHAYVLESGSVVASGAGSDIINDRAVSEAYLGKGAGLGARVGLTQH